MIFTLVELNLLMHITQDFLNHLSPFELSLSVLKLTSFIKNN